MHHPKKQAPKADASFKAEQEKRRREEALANATGIRVLQSIAQDMANHADPRTTKLYDRRKDLATLSEIERRIAFE